MAAWLLIAGPAAAQFSQYVTPGALEEAPQRIRPLLREAMNEAPWHAGRLYLAPWFAIRELAYDDNVGNRAFEPKVSDVTATVGVGLRGYLPFASDLVLAVHALPEYVSWKRLSDRNDLNGRYGIGIFGTVGLADIQASATRVDDDRFLSKELEDRIDSTDEGAELAVDFQLGASFDLFTSSAVHTLSYRQAEEATRFELLNREETVLRIGLRRQLRGGLVLGLGLEDRTAKFDDPDSQPGNSGTSPLGQLRFNGNRFALTTEVIAQTLDFDRDPTFDYSSLLGLVRSVWRPLNFLELQLYADRNLVYSVDTRWAFFEDTKVGLGAVSSLGPIAVGRLFFERGSNDYTSFAEDPVDRLDDFDTVGGNLFVQLGRVTMEIAVFETTFDSNLPILDRTVNNISVGFILGDRITSPWG